MRKTILIVCFILCVIVSWAAYQAKKSDDSRGCEDFLKRLAIADPNLNYSECYEVAEMGARSYRAVYRVSGEVAKKIESKLIEKFAMAPLSFACCGWEPGEGKKGFYEDKNGGTYSISMFSGETPEKDWNQIEDFTVYVEKFIEFCNSPEECS